VSAKQRPGKEQEDGEDAALFREAVRDVKRLVTDRPHPPGKPVSRSRLARRSRPQLPEDDAPGVVAGTPPERDGVFRRPGIQETVLRKLRRGRYGLQGEIDLHGMRVDEARKALRDFLADALALNARCVRIVHGKGLRSGTRGPVIKTTVSTILRHCNSVMAYVPARPDDGGSGAMYVLLARD
jgi:DNA-nicking Smr family endonuclease